MKYVVVTGANKGIGLAIVKAIRAQHQDTVVFLGARDKSRGKAAVDGIIEEHPDFSTRVQQLVLDVSSDDSVSDAARQVETYLDGQPLYGLVNNAGIGFGDANLRQTLEVNTFGMKRMCDAFLPLLDQQQGRVVNITSAAGPNFVSACTEPRQKFLIDPDITWDEINSFIEECLAFGDDKAKYQAAGLGEGNPYGLSKACANCYTVMLARDNPGLVINACTPGFIATDLTLHYVESQGKTAAELGMKSPEDATVAPMFLLFGEPGSSGHYYGSDALRSPLDRYRSPGSPAYTD